jgi:hypothetical protein
VQKTAAELASPKMAAFSVSLIVIMSTMHAALSKAALGKPPWAPVGGAFEVRGRVARHPLCAEAKRGETHAVRASRSASPSVSSSTVSSLLTEIDDTGSLPGGSVAAQRPPISSMR